MKCEIIEKTVVITYNKKDLLADKYKASIRVRENWIFYIEIYVTD